MLLSRAGKEILINAVAQSIPTYTMSVFQLPLKRCDELDDLCAKFGGDKSAMKGRFIGKVGINYQLQKWRVVWDFGI